MRGVRIKRVNVATSESRPLKWKPRTDKDDVLTVCAIYQTKKTFGFSGNGAALGEKKTNDFRWNYDDELKLRFPPRFSPPPNSPDTSFLFSGFAHLVFYGEELLCEVYFIMLKHHNAKQYARQPMGFYLWWRHEVCTKSGYVSRKIFGYGAIVDLSSKKA